MEAAEAAAEAPVRAPMVLSGCGCLTGGVSSLEFSADGSQLASASSDRRLMVWSMESQHLTGILEGHSRCVNSVSWSVDGVVLASGSDDGSVALWDQRTVCRLEGHEGAVTSVKVHPFSNLLASGSFDETLRLWDLRQQRSVDCWQAHTSAVTSVDLSEDGTLLLSSGFDGICRVWDVVTTQCLRSLVDDEGSIGVYRSLGVTRPRSGSARFSPNGQFFLASHMSHSIKLWHPKSRRYSRVYTGHVNRTYCLDCLLTPDSRWIISGSEDSHLFWWDVESQASSSLPFPSMGIATALASSLDGHLLAAGGFGGDNSVQLFFLGRGSDAASTTPVSLSSPPSSG